MLLISELLATWRAVF